MTHRLSKGDFSVATQVQVNDDDEVGVLSRQFSEMAINLEKAYHDLEEYNLLLERKVLLIRSWTSVEKMYTDHLQIRNVLYSLMI